MSSIQVEEQMSKDLRISSLLKKASKRGSGRGFPEFIISSIDHPNFIIVIECKASLKFHASPNLDRFNDYAVDGAIWYASNLASDFDVLAIGVSGQSDQELRVSHRLYVSGKEVKTDLLKDDIFLSYGNYYHAYMHNPVKFQNDYEGILEYSKDLNETLHAKKVKEAHRSLLISGILIALSNTAFRNSFESHKSAKRITKSIVDTIVAELVDADIDSNKVANLKQAYSFIQTHASLSTDKKFIVELIQDIDKKINRFIKEHKYFDTLGQFYIEFLRYANNDKGLGIVLTPPHITELFADIAMIDSDSIIIDNCCGTAGFMISAMRRMIQKAGANQAKIAAIKKHQIVGIEFQHDIYALAVSNMIIHGDGKTNVLYGDCFELSENIDKKGTAGFLNPPYKSKKTDIEELEFVLNNLSILSTNAVCISIIPMRCVLAQRGKGYELKRQLMNSHTVEAVMSMPDELFHNSNVGVVTCVLVVRAHVPHNPLKKTWFGYWKNDGFIKVKNKGRIDVDHNWETIREEWLSAYFNRETKRGASISAIVTPEDEWCAEAYMETDYSNLTESNFEEVLKDYAIFKTLNSN
ncbi:class I SAM-dependent DNA methyltransferase [Lewinella sp. IMCC34183]|uniref:HsdM family class I SAM-dependent methyltransferase n=1 Tax=Lewinella sp. IMCC34183 TaxID=2248762 RepID=UPI0018E50B24|nr:N-6 DNA methylase [Lewinella sp. IMCC34183]